MYENINLMNAMGIDHVVLAWESIEGIVNKKWFLTTNKEAAHKCCFCGCNVYDVVNVACCTCAEEDTPYV